MKNTIQELQEITKEYTKKIFNIPDEEFAAKPVSHKWSKKEVLGHLIDSAQNNLRRFLCAQYGPSPPLIVYDQDFWVTANDYAQAEKEDVIQHWRLINERICSILKTMPAVHYTKTCNTSNEAPQLRTLEWLAGDYVKHMKHHLNQILPDSFDVTYP